MRERVEREERRAPEPDHVSEGVGETGRTRVGMGVGREPKYEDQDYRERRREPDARRYSCHLIEVGACGERTRSIRAR
jgi:hypothetical protein